MADVEEAPKQEQEVTDKEETEELCLPPVVKKDDISDDAASSAKSPSKSPIKSDKKSIEEKVSPAKSTKTSPAKSTKSSPAKSTKSSPAKSTKSSPAKSPNKTKKEDSEDEEDDNGEEEEKKGIYDMPLVIEGKRKRESTSFLKVEEKVAAKHKAPAVAGSGTAFEDIPFVAHQLDAEKKVHDLRPLYRICYGSQGKINVLRKELRKFNGFSFAKNSDEYKRKQAAVSKYTKAELSHIRRILGIAPGKSKDDEVQIIMDFLLKPHDEGKNVPKKAQKRKSSAKDKTSSKTKKKEGTTKKKSISNETVDTESDEDEKSSVVEKIEKKTPKKRKAADEAKTPSKKAKKAEPEDRDEEKEDDHSVTSSSDSSEKKEEKTEMTPSDKEVKAKISELLKTFDLTSVSMKQMVLAVCDAFPEHPQLHERTPSIKAFIKDAIKEDE